MKLNFVVESVYYYCLVDEELPLLDISALDIWLIYLLMFVIFVGRMHDVPMAVKLILLKDLVLYSVNNHCLYRPTNKIQFFHLIYLSQIVLKWIDCTILFALSRLKTEIVDWTSNNPRTFIVQSPMYIPNRFPKLLHRMHCRIIVVHFLDRLVFSEIETIHNLRNKY